MSTEPGRRYAEEILSHIPDVPPVVPVVDPETLDRDVEAISADGLVSATVNRRSLEVTSVRIETIDDLDVAGADVVEAVNSALAAAESGGESSLEEQMAARMAELDAVLDRTTERLDALTAEVDALLAEPITPQTGAPPAN